MPPEQFGPYLVYEELGAGGVATVHRAEMRGAAKGKRSVALKRLHPHLATYPEVVAAFVREARLASLLDHGNIAQTYELGKAGETYFISMEYIPGPTLAQVMKQSALAAGAIPIRMTLGIATQICDAIAYAHALTDLDGQPLGIIHRDISPSNIVISNSGLVKLLDFGIAKVTGKHGATDTPVTGLTIKGKFDYIAPEYLNSGQLDHRADVFAIGVIVHELLTGRRLFAGRDDFETSARVVDMPIPPPSRHNGQIEPDLDRIVLTALQRDPAQRWQSASAMARALTDLGNAGGGLPSASELVDWVKWAFTKTRKHDATGELQRVIDMLDQPSSAEVMLTEEQRRELDWAPIPTLQGVGAVPARPAPPPPPPPPPPLIVNAEPVQKRPSEVQPIPRPIPVHEELAPDDTHWGALRIMFFLLTLMIAAVAGVVTTAYVLDLELPLIGRW